jgi:hypothetical protein
VADFFQKGILNPFKKVKKRRRVQHQSESYSKFARCSENSKDMAASRQAVGHYHDKE